MLVMFGQDAVRLAAPTAPAVVSSSPRACTEGWLGFPQSESQLPNMFSAPGILPKNEPKDAKQLKNEDSNNSNDKKKIYWVRREGWNVSPSPKVSTASCIGQADLGDGNP